MNYRYIKSIFYSLFAIAVLTMTSCNDLDLDPIDPSVRQDFDQNGVFAKIYATLALTGQEAPAGIGDIHGLDEGTSSFVRLLFNVNVLSTDEALCSWADDPGVPELNFNSWSSGHAQIRGMYSRLYFNITLCNFFLEQTVGATDSHTIKQRADVRFLRALNYFYVLDMFGNAPFTEVVSKVAPPRILRADLFKYVEKELLETEPDMYEPLQAPTYRVDKVANWLLLSRLYLNAKVYTGTEKWADAAKYAKKVMDSPYKLSPSYEHLFMADNYGLPSERSSVNKAAQEIILSVAADGVKTYTYGASMFLIASTHTAGMPSWGSTEGWGGNRARVSLVKKFFPSGVLPTTDPDKLANGLHILAKDDRAMLFGFERTVEIEDPWTFKQGLSVKKFSNIRADGKQTSNLKFVDADYPLLRVAEAYLTFAEATLRSNGNSAEALRAVNAIRTRAHATEWVSVDLDNILDEWSREFYFEGRRRMDLIRYDKFGASDYNWDWKGGTAGGTKFSAIYNLFPIPYTDLKANPNLIQNPGY